LRKLLWFASLVVVLAGMSAPALSSEKLYLYTENFPPYNMSATGRAFEHNGDQIDGLCTEMVKAILHNTDLDYVMKLRNWDYGYNRALNKPNHGIFCTTYTAVTVKVSVALPDFYAAIRTASVTTFRSGFNDTNVTGSQLRVPPLQRSGRAALAARLSA